MLDGSPTGCDYWAVNTPKTIKQNKEFIDFMENQTVSFGNRGMKVFVHKTFNFQEFKQRNASSVLLSTARINHRRMVN